MTYDALVSMIGHYGYAALFFALWLGIVGMPIPDEVIVMTGGAATASGLLHEVPAFALTYMGVISGLSLGYFLGRLMGARVIEKWKRKKKMEKYLTMSEKLVEKYGHYALVVSYFFPVVRHVTPYIVGINKMSFRKYALLSYSTGFVWTLIFFAAGRMAGDHVEQVGLLVHSYGLKLLWVPIAAAGIWVLYKMARSKRSNLDAGN